jgi:hypothetical protein
LKHLSVTGVFHSAAVLDDGPIADITPENLARFARVLSSCLIFQSSSRARGLRTTHQIERSSVAMTTHVHQQHCLRWSSIRGCCFLSNIFRPSGWLCQYSLSINLDVCWPQGCRAQGDRCMDPARAHAGFTPGPLRTLLLRLLLGRPQPPSSEVDRRQQ